MIDPRDPDFTNTPASSQRPKFHYVADRPIDAGVPPVVSVVTGTNRAGEIFRETARCIIGQSLQTWEWLIVDDASNTRASRELLDEIAASDPRIRVLRHSQNRGPGAARNTGVKAAASHYIYFIDDDDLIEPTTLEECLWFLESHAEYDFVDGWSVAFGDQRYLWRMGFEQGAAFLEDNLATGRCMIRKCAYDAVGGFDESLLQGFEDWDLWLRCARNGSWGSTIPHFMDWYRRREDHSDRWGDWDEGTRKKQFRERMRKRYPDLYVQGFPENVPRTRVPFAPHIESLPCDNRLSSKRRRILFVLPWLSMGGSDKFNLDLVVGLRKSGWEVSIVTTLHGHSGWESEFARHTPDIFHLHHFLPLEQHARFLRYFIASRQPEIVLVSHSELAYLITPYLRAHCPSPVYLDYCHIEQEEWLGGGYPRLSVSSQSHFDLNIVSSVHLRDWMCAQGADRGKIEVLYTNVDTSQWQPMPASRKRLRKAWQIDEKTPVILFSGRICAQKQPMVLAHTLLELANRGCDFRLVVAGDGEDRAELETFVRRKRLGRRVKFLGEISNKDMRDVMSAADIFFLPSQWEGIALSIFEAMAMKLAIVAADVGGQRELVTPKYGMLLPRADETTEAKAYADALEGLLMDPERRRSLGRLGRERVQRRFRLDSMVDRFVTLVDEAEERRAQTGAAATLAPELAASLVTQAVEYLRMSALADQLWAERESLHSQSSAGKSSGNLAVNLNTEAWLDHIEKARSWLWVRRLHRSLIGRLARRLKLAKDVEAIAAINDPSERLSKIEATRSYRIIRVLKSTPIHRLWARIRYGQNHAHTSRR